MPHKRYHPTPIIASDEKDCQTQANVKDLAQDTPYQNNTFPSHNKAENLNHLIPEQEARKHKHSN